MTMIRRYIAREIVGAVLFVLAGFLGLFAFFDFINEIDDVGQAGYRLQHALAHVLLGLPSRVYELMPIAALIGSIYALAQFASHSEFTAMRAAGLSRRGALAIVAGVGAWFAVATALTGELLAPASERLAQSIRLSALASTVGAQFRSGLWIKDTLKDASGQVDRLRFVNVAEMRPDTTLRAVRVFEFDSQYRLVAQIEAANARFTPPSGWLLQEVEITTLTPVVVADTTATLRAQRHKQAELAWASDLN
nr:LptF/LptG family permease [Burkholderiaceae bacterium]